MGKFLFQQRKILKLISLIIGATFLIWMICEFYKETLSQHFTFKFIHFKESSCESILGEGNFSDVVNTISGECIHVPQPLAIRTNIKEDEFESCLRIWNPKGCSLYLYSKKEASNCMKISSRKKKYIFLIGDSRMFNLYFQISTIFGAYNISSPYSKEKLFRSDFINEEVNLNITFHRKGIVDSNFVDLVNDIKEVSKNQPLILVIGISLHMVSTFNESIKGIEKFQFYLTQVKQVLHDMALNSLVLWFMSPAKSNSMKAHRRYSVRHSPYRLPKNIKKKTEYVKKYAEMIQEKALESLKNNRERNEMFKFVYKYNEEAQKILSGTPVKLWFGPVSMGEQTLDDYDDHVHLASYVNYNLMQVMLNIFCNEKMNVPPHHCCS
ncbi:UNVERIFIED_CONTAM: hypothetical protein RMT77_016610 [Armadillidium vulgare]